MTRGTAVMDAMWYSIDVTEYGMDRLMICFEGISCWLWTTIWWITYRMHTMYLVMKLIKSCITTRSGYQMYAHDFFCYLIELCPHLLIELKRSKTVWNFGNITLHLRFCILAHFVKRHKQDFFEKGPSNSLKCSFKSAQSGLKLQL